jgi:DNA-binding response OmpR family regulator
MTEEKKGDRILIVDDTLQNIQVLGTVLREQQYQINVAQNGLQALELVAKVIPDLILLDIMMPELDGFATCERLKADEKTRDIPIIFLTAKTETDDIVRGFELGAVDYVTKPFNPTELLARVRTHLTMQRLRRELKVYNGGGAHGRVTGSAPRVTGEGPRTRWPRSIGQCSNDAEIGRPGL